MDINLVTDIIRVKLNDASITDQVILYAVDEVSTVIKNYCNLEDVPEALKYTVANMSVDLITSNTLSSIDVTNPESTGKVGIGAISDVKVGDTEVKFTRGGNGTGVHVIDVDSILFNYKQQLKKYRRLVW